MDREQGRPESGPSRQQDETEPASALTAEPTVTIQTSNFRQVLLHFDDDGNPTDSKNVRLSIPCAICLGQLSITNDRPGEHAGLTYEPYAVLVRCGHAFGYKCIVKVLLSENMNGRKCPICRTSVYCKRGHVIPLVLYGDNTDMDIQAQQIKEIRKKLDESTCEKCSGESDTPTEHQLNKARRIIACARNPTAELSAEASYFAAQLFRKVEEKQLARILYPFEEFWPELDPRYHNPITLLARPRSHSMYPFEGYMLELGQQPHNRITWQTKPRSHSMPRIVPMLVEGGNGLKIHMG